MKIQVGKSWGLAALGLVCGALCVHCGSDGGGNPSGSGASPAGAGAGAGGEAEVGGNETSPGGAANPQAGETSQGGSGNAGDTSSAGAGAGGEPTVMGEHHGYVLDTMELPANDAQMKEISLDIDGNGKAENRLGLMWSSLAAQGFVPNVALDAAVQDGTVIDLADIQAPSLGSALAAGFSTFYGKDPMPAPCVKANDCGHHLLGTGTFTVDMLHLGEPAVGRIVNSELRARGGKLPIKLTLAGDPLDLMLEHPIVDAKALSDTDMGPVLIGGAVPATVVDDQILPALKDGAAALIARDCVPKGMACGCVANSTGAALLNLFDTDKSCTVTAPELKANMALSTVLSPDLDFDGDMKPEMLSVVLRATAKRATFDVP